MPSTISQAGHEMSVQLLRGKDLAALDGASLIKDATSDPYCSLVFVGSDPVMVTHPLPLRVPKSPCADNRSVCCAVEYEEVNVQPHLEREAGPAAFSPRDAGHGQGLLLGLERHGR